MSLRIVKSIALAVGVLLGVSTGASAATVSTVVPVPGGATLTDPTGFGFSDPLGFTFSGIFGTASGGPLIVPVPALQTTGSVIIPPVPEAAPFGSFIVTDIPPIPQEQGIAPPPPTIFLAGELLDFSAGFSTVDMLFSVTDGVLASAFGNLVLVSVFNEPVLSLASSTSTQQVQAVPGLTITSVTPVPLPAALPLLLTGLGLFVAMRRRK